MEQIKALTQELGTWLDRVTVSGDSVDYLAMARQTYRQLCTALQTKQQTTQPEDSAHG